MGADHLVCHAEELMQGKKMFDKSRDMILRDLRKRGGTESSKMLMFTYKCQFAAILGQSLDDLR